MKRFWDYWDKFVSATFSISGVLVILAIAVCVFIAIGFFIFGFYYNLYDTFKLLFV